MLAGVFSRLLILTVTVAGFFAFGGATSGVARGKTPHPSLEPVADVPGRPRVLLLGDSISMDYTLDVRTALATEANVHRPPVNCHHSSEIIEHLDEWLGDGAWDVIHFNCGIHDVTRWKDGEPKPSAEGAPRVPLDHYRRNLGRIVTRLKATGASLVWASTTPLGQAYSARGFRRNDDVLAWNAAAAEVMRERGVALNDLHALCAAEAETMLRDGVHFTKPAAARQAQQVAREIRRQLSARAAAPAPPPAREQRRLAADRPRRLVINNDGAEPAVLMTEPTEEDFLRHRTTLLADTPVDAIFYCPRSSGFGVFTHRTKAGQVFGLKTGRYVNNQTEAMHARGLDPLQLVTDFAHRHGKEAFFSLRMNDTHDAHISKYGADWFADNRLKTTHPEWLLGAYDTRLKHGAWSAVNYAVPEVRELAFQFVVEACLNYDVDGVELDFFRHPCFFPSTTQGAEASAAELEAMTELVRRIRGRMDEIGTRRGRALLLAVHAPDCPDYARAMGLDLERWMADGLFDLWIAGGTFRLRPWAESVALAKRHGVKILPSLDDPRVKDTLARELRSTPDAWRGRAAEAWAAGADGISLFNFYDVVREDGTAVLRDLADPVRLAARPQDVFASWLGQVNSSAGNFPLDAFMKLPLLDGGRPRSLAAGGTERVPLVLWEDYGATKPAALELRLRVTGSKADAALPRLAVNGTTIDATRLTRDGEWLSVAVTPAELRVGSNDVSLTAGNTPLRWLDALLRVRRTP